MIYVFETPAGIKFVRADEHRERTARAVVCETLPKDVKVLNATKMEEVPDVEETIVGKEKVKLIARLPNWADLCEIVSGIAKVYNERARYAEFNKEYGTP